MPGIKRRGDKGHKLFSKLGSEGRKMQIEHISANLYQTIWMSLNAPHVFDSLPVISSNVCHDSEMWYLRLKDRNTSRKFKWTFTHKERYSKTTGHCPAVWLAAAQQCSDWSAGICCCPTWAAELSDRTSSLLVVVLTGVTSSSSSGSSSRTSSSCRGQGSLTLRGGEETRRGGGREKRRERGG